LQDFQLGDMGARGGIVAARQLLGADLPVLVEELNEELVA